MVVRACVNLRCGPRTTQTHHGLTNVKDEIPYPAQRRTFTDMCSFYLSEQVFCECELHLAILWMQCGHPRCKSRSLNNLRDVLLDHGSSLTTTRVVSQRPQPRQPEPEESNAIELGWGAWSEWGACSVRLTSQQQHLSQACGGGGTRTRHRCYWNLCQEPCVWRGGAGRGGAGRGGAGRGGRGGAGL